MKEKALLPKEINPEVKFCVCGQNFNRTRPIKIVKEAGMPAKGYCSNKCLILAGVLPRPEMKPIVRINRRSGPKSVGNHGMVR